MLLARQLSHNMGALSFKDSEPCETSSDVTMLVYNIWFGKFRMEERMQGLGKIIQELNPDVIALNEVTRDNLFLLKSQAWFSNYKLLPMDIHNQNSYFVVILTKLTVRSWNICPFSNSCQGRKLLTAELRVRVPHKNKTKVVSLTIATAHLESMDYNTREREQQLQISIKTLTTCSNACVMGDLNLEQKVDGDVILPNGWLDAWLSISGNCHENGYTWDPTINKMNKDTGSAQNRLDRVFCKLSDFAVKSMKIVGKDELSPGVYPSDHFGAFVVLEPTTENEQRSGFSSRMEGGVSFKRPAGWERFLRK